MADISSAQPSASPSSLEKKALSRPTSRPQSSLIPALLPPLLTGTLFGASLTATNLHQPLTLLNSFSLTDTSLLQTYLSASACSTVIIYVARKLKFAKLPHRTNTTLGWFGSYDANVLGGAVQGVGMGLTGADPGGMLIQGVLGMGQAVWVCIGGCLGGVVYVFGKEVVEQRERERRGDWVATENGTEVVEKTGKVLGQNDDETRAEMVKPGADVPADVPFTTAVRTHQVAGKESKVAAVAHTIQERLHVSEAQAVLGYELLLLGSLYSIEKLNLVLRGTKAWGRYTPIVGGLLIGIAQAGSVLLAKKTLGVSGAFEEIGLHIYNFYLRARKRVVKSVAGYSNMAFAMGIMLGARLVSWRVPSTSHGGLRGMTRQKAIVGGLCTIFGARLAGGCTSGHGISGVSTLSVSSFITVGSMLGGGVILRSLLDRL